MLPLLPFAAGLLAGAAAVKLLRSEFTRNGLEATKEKWRHASMDTLPPIDQQADAKQKPTKVKKAAAPEATVDTSVPVKRSVRKKNDSRAASTNTRRKAPREITK